MGHLLSAACAHHRATGKGTFLEVARKVADYLHATFAPPRRAAGAQDLQPLPDHGPGGAVPQHRRAALPGRGERLYRLPRRHARGQRQMQDRVPLREESQVVGHMVLSTYLYAGATDAYLETGDEMLKAALDRMWDDLTKGRTLRGRWRAPVHRGLGAPPPGGTDAQRGQGRPARTAHDARRVPDRPHQHAPGRGPRGCRRRLRAAQQHRHNETCAQIGTVLWNWRLLAASASARYAEAIEHALYNSVLSGIGLEGASWFYTNPLRFYGAEHSCSATMRTRASSAATATSAAPATWRVRRRRARPGLRGVGRGPVGQSVRRRPLRRPAPRRGPFRAAPGDGLPVGGSGAPHDRSAPEAEVALALRIPSWAEGATLRVVEQTGSRPESGAAPGRITPRAGPDELLVSHVDVAPTLLDLLGVPPLPGAPPFQGQSLAHSLTSGVPLEREAVFGEATGGERGDRVNPQADARRVPDRPYQHAPGRGPRGRRRRLRAAQQHRLQRDLRPDRDGAVELAPAGGHRQRALRRSDRARPVQQRAVRDRPGGGELVLHQPAALLRRGAQAAQQRRVRALPARPPPRLLPQQPGACRRRRARAGR